MGCRWSLAQSEPGLSGSDGRGSGHSLCGVKMKVAFVTNFCAHYRIRTFEELARRYDTDFLFFSAGDDWHWEQRNGIWQGEFRSLYLPGVRLGRTRVTPTLVRELLRGDYDVYVKCINGRFALPVVYLIARLRGKPFVLWTGIWHRLQSRAHRFGFPFTKYIYTHADAIVVYGSHVKRYLVSEGAEPSRIFTTTHAVDNSAYDRPVSQSEIDDLRAECAISPEQKVILYLGRVITDKGLDYLLEAFATLNQDDAVLLLAGEGRERKRLEQLALRLGIGARVRFTGYVPIERTPIYYALAWVLVLPSVTTAMFKEPWGLVVNEAFNQGTPVIASDAVGAAAGGLVQHEVTGMVVPERNSAALRRAMDRILHEPGLRERLSANARRTIATWDNKHMVDGFARAIGHVTGSEPHLADGQPPAK